MPDLVVLFGYNENTTGLPPDQDFDLFFARFDYSAPDAASAFNIGNDMAEADETLPGPATPLNVFDFDARISRDTDYILIGYIQEDAGGLLELKFRRFINAHLACENISPVSALPRRLST